MKNMEANQNRILKTIAAFQLKFGELDAMTVDQLANSRVLEGAPVFADYLYYNILMIKNSGSKLLGELRKLRYEKFIQVHTQLFYSKEEAEQRAHQQIEWFNKQLAN